MASRCHRVLKVKSTSYVIFELFFPSQLVLRVRDSSLPRQSLAPSLFPASKSNADSPIFQSGPNVFLGYHNNASATTSSITPDGFFKTGDIGYEDADGNMYITDRVKELIKYKGFQVAPAELEGVLMGCEMVEDCAVIGVWDGERESEVPMACVVARGKREEGELVRWMAERVAGHKQLRGGVWWVDEVCVVCFLIVCCSLGCFSCWELRWRSVLDSKAKICSHARCR